jgi:hypothetical protein
VNVSNLLFPVHPVWNMISLQATEGQWWNEGTVAVVTGANRGIGLGLFFLKNRFNSETDFDNTATNHTSALVFLGWDTV